MSKRRKKRRKAITPEKLKAAYRECLMREKDRIRHNQRSKQGAFEQSMMHYQFCDDGLQLEDGKLWQLSDCGVGAALVRRHGRPIGRDLTPAERQRCIHRAQMRVSRKCPEALPVLWQILKNGKEGRASSIRWIAEHLVKSKKRG